MKDLVILVFFWDFVFEVFDFFELEVCCLSDGLSRRLVGLGRVNGVFILWELCDKGL